MGAAVVGLDVGAVEGWFELKSCKRKHKFGGA